MAVTQAQIDAAYAKGKAIADHADSEDNTELKTHLDSLQTEVDGLKSKLTADEDKSVLDAAVVAGLTGDTAPVATDTNADAVPPMQGDSSSGQ